ncbi:chemotaxis protein CheW [Achromobacter denitrificans]
MSESPDRLSDVDDCWNRAGIRGDKSCERLRDHAHCRNCPVYAEAARRILDRLPPQMEEGDGAPAQARGDQSPLLVFRVQREWLGLPTRALDEVAGMRRILGLPHRRDPAMLGVANVRGTLTVCVSLSRLLGLAPEAAQARERPGAARMLILGGAGRAAVLPVDEVEGIHGVDLGRLVALPATVDGAKLKYSLGMARCGGLTVGVLDEALLLQALERSLA